MNGWSYWKRLNARCLVGAIALALGLAHPVAAQLPDTLPPIHGPVTPAARSTASLPGALLPTAAVGQPNGQPINGLPKSETPRNEIPTTPAPTTSAPVLAEPMAAPCDSCQRQSLFGMGFHRKHGGCASGGCGGGGCSAGTCGSGQCSSGGCATGGPHCNPPCYGCGYGGCFPGHQPCCGTCEHDGPIGSFLCCFYQCLCCPDPCYEPRFIPEANSAFWVDSARPVTQTRIRWDAGFEFQQPDRSEFFWARIGVKGPKNPEPSLRYHDLSIYQEVAAKKGSIFFETVYRNVDPNAIGNNLNPHAAGFGDMNVGTKALLFDCELMQLTFQFRTFLPVGNSAKGLGTGHVSLEPSLLYTLKLCPETYFQAQVSEWIPIGGDPLYAGSVLHYHFAINHVICRILPDVPVIGGVETNAYSFQDGQFTDPVLGANQKSSGSTWFQMGPSMRISVCKKLDFGLSTMFGFDPNGPEQLYRTEFRYRF